MTPWALVLTVLMAGGAAPDRADPTTADGPRTPVRAPAPSFAGARPIPAIPRVRLLPPVRPVPPHASPWTGEDKLRHLGMAFAVTEIGFGLARLGLSAEHARTTGLALALVASVGKEVYDVRRGGPFSVPDLAWDVAGIALGAVLIRQIE